MSIIKCMISKPAPSEKYSPEVRRFAMTLHYHSPRAYVFVREKFHLNLPSESTIRIWIRNSDMDAEPGIHESVLRVLKNKVVAKKAEGSELVCSLAFDEMHIRKHVQWNHPSKHLQGYVTYGWDPTDGSEKPQANQAIVFMVNGLNEKFTIPVAYHFIAALTAEKKRDLLLEVIAALHSVSVRVASLTFDGLSSNKRMCHLLGANFAYGTPQFKPYFTAVNGDPIYIFWDACHMLKLIRNTFGQWQVLSDGDNQKIEWKYLEYLVECKEKNMLNLTHKLTRKHMQWYRKKMKVSIATQTLSESTANSMEFLLKSGHESLIGSEGTTKFCRYFNNIFDVFNAKSCDHINPFKQSLSRENKEEVFQLLDDTEVYISHLSKNLNSRKVLVIKSKKNTGFLGFLYNIHSLKLMFEYYVEQNRLLVNIPTFYTMQDTLEVFFGKNRARYGFNDNPTAQQLSASYKQLIVYDHVSCSKYMNCESNEEYEILSNIMEVSSRQRIAEEIPEYDPNPDDLNDIHALLAQIEQTEQPNSTRILEDAEIAYVASVIEHKFKTSEIYCYSCIRMFYDDEKFDELLPSSRTIDRPCKSTISICKTASRYMKPEFLNGTYKFDMILYSIYCDLDYEALYAGTDFSGHEEHKRYFIRTIVYAYAHIRGTQIAQNITLCSQKKFVRSQYRKSLHILGQ